jgi:DNA-binding NarL/FixJ family response regulator
VNSHVVLIVDDAPASIDPLCRDLEAQGCTVLVACDGQSALERLERVTPDAILLDAVMPGLDGFETCRRIKAQAAHAHIPVVFMTGLSETEHIVAGFAAGGVDYVVKPVCAAEVLARLGTHVRNARQARLVREAVDVAGMGVLTLDAFGRVAWCSPQARRWLRAQFGTDTNADADADADAGIDSAVRGWLHAAGDPRTTRTLAAPDARMLLVAQPCADKDWGETLWLLSLRPANAPEPSRLATAALTPREAEVLSWVAKGKTNRDIADILGMSPRTVNKHLEHVFEKLGVETRAAAAALASRDGA